MVILTILLVKDSEVTRVSSPYKVLILLMWTKWRERNARCLEDREKSKEDLKKHFGPISL